MSVAGALISHREGNLPRGDERWGWQDRSSLIAVSSWVQR
jgi:hypothetical protein